MDFNGSLDFNGGLNMSTVRVCRICLAVGVKFHNIGPLHGYYQALVALTEVCGSAYVCYECAGHLMRFSQLKDKAERTQTLLRTILQNEREITPDSIKFIDREEYKLQSFLKTSDIKYLDVKQEVTATDLLKTEFDVDVIVEGENANSDLKRDSIRMDEDDWKDDDTVEVLEADIKVEPLHLDTEFLSVPCDFDSSSVRLRRKKCDRKVKRRKVRCKKIKSPESKRKLSKSLIPCRKEARNEFFSKFVDILPMTHEEAMDEIVQRKESRNYRISTYKCDKCFKGFWEKPAFDNHAMKHDEKTGAFECDFCHFRFPCRKRLMQHIGQCHKWKFCCRKCPYVVGDGSRATKHEDWHNGKKYQCKQCSKSFSYYSTMMNHARKEHAKEVSCRLCGLCFVGRHGVRVHTFKVHADTQIKEEGGHRCVECDIDFASMEALKRHRVVSAKHNLKETANGCEECGEVFPTREDYRLHHRKAHARKMPSYRIRCDLSSGLPPSAYDEKAPRKKRTKEEIENENGQGEEVHMCDVCGKTFQTCYTLKYHIQKHTGDLPNKCTYCGKAFRSRDTLSEHERTHTHEKPFRCELCSRAFAASGNLSRHIKTVHETKPVQCEICSKLFKNDPVLKDHVKYVHLKVPYPVRRGKKHKGEEGSGKV